jgi:hypothetical protein
VEEGGGGGDSWSICQDPADQSSLQLGGPFLYTLLIRVRQNQGVTKRCRLFGLTNSASVYEH